MSNPDPIALYIVIRESLNMGMGKACAQSGHAVENVIHEFYSMISCPEYHSLDEEERKRRDVFEKWGDSGSRKITLIANEEEWEALKKEFGPSCNLVIDSGITDLEPGTETAMAFFPQYKSARSRSIKRLRSCQ